MTKEWGYPPDFPLHPGARGSVVKELSSDAEHAVEHPGRLAVQQHARRHFGRVKPGSAVVICYEEPVGSPGMREMQMTTSIKAVVGLAEMTAVVTDGRFSGSTWGLCIGHISPEAALSEPIAVVQDGDVIALSISKHRLKLEVPDDKIKRRFEGCRRCGGRSMASLSCTLTWLPRLMRRPSDRCEITP